MIERKDVALSGERTALDFLRKKGFRIINKNYRTKFGEIDIVAQDKRTLCFIEVRTRNTDTQISPKESVDSKKQERISKSTLSYLKEKKLLKKKARFDVISISIKKSGEREIELIKNAFSLNPKFLY